MRKLPKWTITPLLKAARDVSKVRLLDHGAYFCPDGLAAFRKYAKKHLPREFTALDVVNGFLEGAKGLGERRNIEGYMVRRMDCWRLVCLMVDKKTAKALWKSGLRTLEKYPPKSGGELYYNVDGELNLELVKTVLEQ